MFVLSDTKLLRINLIISELFSSINRSTCCGEVTKFIAKVAMNYVGVERQVALKCDFVAAIRGLSYPVLYGKHSRNVGTI